MTKADLPDSIPPEEIADLRAKITDEVFNALGFYSRGWARRSGGPLFYLPTQRFAQITAEIDHLVENQGLRAGLSTLLGRFVTQVDIRGAQTIPAEGPLIVASNHPGAYDGLAIVSSLPRDDIKVITSEIPFVHHLKATYPYVIEAPADTHRRLGAVRKTIRHLQAGGAVLIFPSGQVDPDPDWLPGAHEGLELWSESLALWLHKVPETRLLPTIASNVISPRWINSPMVRFQKGWKRYRLAEFFQVMEQLLFNRHYDLVPRVSFGEARRYYNPGDESDLHSTQAAVVTDAQQLLAAHMESGESRRAQA